MTKTSPPSNPNPNPQPPKKPEKERMSSKLAPVIEEIGAVWPLFVGLVAIIAFGVRLELGFRDLTEEVSDIGPRLSRIEAKQAAYDEGIDRYYGITMPALQKDVSDLKKQSVMIETTQAIILKRLEELSLQIKDNRRAPRETHR